MVPRFKQSEKWKKIAICEVTALFLENYNPGSD